MINTTITTIISNTASVCIIITIILSLPTPLPFIITPAAHQTNYRCIHYSFADDEPDEEGSPQHYVLIHGFLSASILQHLANIGVQVNAIIKLQQDEYRTIPPAYLTEETHEDVEEEVIEPGN